jgi:sec-independent protein translocase protein TatA
MGSIGAPEIIGLLLVALLLFGAKRLPEIGRSLGSGMREFKDSVTGKGEDEPPAQLPPPAVTMTPPTPPEAAVAPPVQQPPAEQ